MKAIKTLEGRKEGGQRDQLPGEPAPDRGAEMVFIDAGVGHRDEGGTVFVE